MDSEYPPSCFSSSSAQVQSLFLFFSTCTFSPLHMWQSVMRHIKTLYSFHKHTGTKTQLKTLKWVEIGVGRTRLDIQGSVVLCGIWLHLALEWIQIYLEDVEWSCNGDAMIVCGGIRCVLIVADVSRLCRALEYLAWVVVLWKQSSVVLGFRWGQSSPS